MTDSAAERLQHLGLTLPPGRPAVSRYANARAVGELLWISGHGPIHEDGSAITGVVGDDLDVPHAQAAARLTMLNVLSTIAKAAGDLDRVTEFCRLLVLVRASADFTDHPQVADGASTLVYDVFGDERGAHARSAIGVTSLPFGICVEIEVTVRLALHR